MKIVIDSDIPYIQGVFEPFADVLYLKGDRISRGEVADADALVVRTRTRCDRSLLHNTKVGFIATATIGFDHIDMDYCAANGIGVATSAGCNARAVLQWYGAVLAADSGKRGWTPDERCVGVVGVGNVGSLVADYSARWGARVVCCDPPRQRRGDVGFVPLDELAARCDIITFHVPLNRTGADQTLDMGGKEFFGLVRPGTLIINSSRGEVLDESELKRAIVQKNITCALDTWRGEPDLDRELLSASSYATQHIAGYSIQGKAMATAMSVEALSRHFGLPLADWYPAGPPRSQARDISWGDMKLAVRDYIDVDAMTAALKSHPESFEELRCRYPLRREYY